MVLNVAQREQNREILCPFCVIVALLSIWRERNNGLMISVCLPNRLPSLLIGWIHWVANVNWPLLKVSKLTFRALALRLSLWRKAHVPNVSFETLNGSQFTLSTQLVLPNYPVILPHRLNTTIFLETNPPYSFTKLVDSFLVSLLLLCFLKNHSTLITLLSHTSNYQTFCRLTSSNDLWVLIAKYWSEFLVESKIHITKQSKVNNGFMVNLLYPIWITASNSK